MIHRKIVKALKRESSAQCVVDKATGRNFTNGDLLNAAYLLAGELSKSKEGYIGIMLPTTFIAMAANLAVHLAGKVPVLINFSTGAEQNISFAREKCGFKTVMTVSKLYSNTEDSNLLVLDEYLAGLSPVHKVMNITKGKASSLLSAYKEHEEDTALILFTSGSEKEPKAVELSHRNILSNVEGAIEMFDFTSSDTFASILPLFHVFGYTLNYVLPLSLGMKIVALPSPLEYQKVVTAIKEEGVSVIAGTPVFINGYARKAKEGDFDSLRIVVAGADKLSASLIETYQDRFGIDLIEGYGTTETSPVISANTIAENRFGSVGKPFPGVSVKIVELEGVNEVPTGESGKIFVKGDLVMKGYLDDIEETYNRIKDGWYDTGDMGHFDSDGYLWHDGRLKRFAKIGGEMVSLVQVESLLSDLLGADHQCCVVEVPDPVKGGRIIAAVSDGADMNGINKKLKKILPSIALPKTYLTFESLPVLGNGKINFREVTHLCYELLNKR